MPKIDIDKAPTRVGVGYPKPFRPGHETRVKKALGDAGGLTQFGVNLTTIPPGTYSALYHWHETEDEFVYMLEGELVLIEDGEETVLRPGDAATFKAGEARAHRLVNRTERDAVYLEVGTRSPRDHVTYPDDDLVALKDGTPWVFRRKNGEPYPKD